MKCKIEFELPDILRGSIETAFVHWKFKGFSGQAKATRVLPPEAKLVQDIADPIVPKIDIGRCPSCNKLIDNLQSKPTRYCKYCGQKVKWE
jgi:hypothetical protein